METSAEQDKTFCTIQAHAKSAIIAVCTSPDCISHPFCCVKCLVTTHKMCQTSILFFEDIYGPDHKKLIEHPKFEKFPLSSVAPKEQVIAQEEFKNLYLKALETEFYELKSSVLKEFQIIEDNVKNANPKNLEYNLNRIYETFIQEIGKIDLAKSVLPKQAFLNVINKQLEIAKNKGVVDNKALATAFHDFIIACQAITKDQISQLMISTFIKDIAFPFFNEIQKEATKLVNIKISDQCLSALQKWHWDPTHCNANVKLTEDNMVATKEGGASHTGVLGNVVFKKGKHIWEITCTGITANNGDFIQFGLISSGTIPDSGNFSTAYAFSSATYGSNGNYVYNIDYTGGTLNCNNKTFRVEYDADEGNLLFTGNGIKGEKKGLKGADHDLSPFVLVYHNGNKATLKIIK